GRAGGDIPCGCRLRIRRRARRSARSVRPGKHFLRLRPPSRFPIAPMNPDRVSILKRVLGALIVIGIIAFIVYGLYLANRPVVAPLQGQIDGRYIDISPKIVGRIAKLHVREGDEVKPGALVVTLDSPEIEAKVSGAEAARDAAAAKQQLLDTGIRQEEVRVARANWERAVSAATLAETTYKRINALYRDGLVS